MPKSAINDGHLLQDLARFYDSGYELIIGEIIGNAVDIDATELAITLADDKTIEFFNNAKPMFEKDFDTYHTLAKSTKVYGKSLGWAGVGAKLYLGIKTDTTIVTTSSDGTTTTASEMFLKDQEQLWHEFVPSTDKFYGTKYKVRLAEKDFEVLQNNVKELIISMYNTAMINGLKIKVNGIEIVPWTPKITHQEVCELKIGTKTLAFNVIATTENIPEDRCNVEYHIFGKRIVDRAPKNLLPMIKKECRRKFYVLVDAINISDQLKTDKEAFRPGEFTSKVEPGIERKLLEILKKWNFLEDQKDIQTKEKQFTKILEDMLKQIPELKMEGPSGFSSTGGKSRGKGTKTSQANKQTQQQNASKNQRKPKKPRRKGGLSITTVWKADDERQGWTQITTNEIVVNLAHRTAQLISKTRAGKEYHLLRVVSNELVKHAAKKVELSVEKALEYSDKLFNGLAIARAQNPRKQSWNFQEDQITKRDDDGRFMPKDSD